MGQLLQSERLSSGLYNIKHSVNLRVLLHNDTT